MTTTTDNLNILGLIARSGAPVRFFNTYHGVPISYEGQILSVETQVVSAIVHEYQAVCIAEDLFTYIQSDQLSTMLSAKCIEVDFAAREVRLTNFAMQDSSAGQRTRVRVSPREPVEAEIYNNSGRRVQGILADVSTIGVGVLTFSAYQAGELAFDMESDVFVDVHFPNQMMHFQGKVASVQERGRFTHRIGLQVQPDAVSENALRSYIAVRQEELLLELGEKYEILRKQPRKKTGPLS